MTGPGSGLDDADLVAVIALDGEVFGSESWSPEVWRQTAASAYREVDVVPSEEDGIDGFAVLALLGDVADLERIAVAPSRRRHGVGTRLLGYAVARANAAGAGAVVLEVRADNAAALSFYDEFGFREVGRRRGYFAEGTVDAVLMEKQC